MPVALGAAHGEKESVPHHLPAVIGDVGHVIAERAREIDEQARVLQRRNDPLDRYRRHGAALTRTSAPGAANVPASGDVALAEPSPSSCTRNPAR